MEGKKNIQKFTYVVIGLAVLALIGVLLYQQYLIKRPLEDTEPIIDTASNIEVSETSDNHGSFVTEAGSDKNNHKFNALEKVSVATENQSRIENQYEPESRKNTLDSKEQDPLPPYLEKMLRTAVTDSLEIQYGPLFVRLNLSEEKLAAFQEILTDRKMTIHDFTLETPPRGSLSQEDAMERDVRIKFIESECIVKVKELLGQKAGSLYESYSERVEERALFIPFSESLSESDRLTETEQKVFIDAMHEERLKLEANLPFEKSSLYPVVLSDADASEAVEYNDLIAERYMALAKTHLSESQSKQFTKYLLQQRREKETLFKNYFKISPNIR